MRMLVCYVLTFVNKCGGVVKVGKRVRDATLLSIFQFFTFAARI